jgi:hypothetical protein
MTRLKATLPDGTTTTIRTSRPFAYVVVVRNSASLPWFDWCWCSRLDLAEKQARKAANKERYPDVVIVPVAA